MAAAVERSRTTLLGFMIPKGPGPPDPGVSPAWFRVCVDRRLRPQTLPRLKAQKLFSCGFPVLAYGGGSDPTLSYANAAALQLWETTWADLIGLLSRLTAPESERSERRQALEKLKRCMPSRVTQAFASVERSAGSRSTTLGSDTLG